MTTRKEHLILYSSETIGPDVNLWGIYKVSFLRTSVYDEFRSLIAAITSQTSKVRITGFDINMEFRSAQVTAGLDADKPGILTEMGIPSYSAMLLVTDDEAAVGAGTANKSLEQVLAELIATDRYAYQVIGRSEPVCSQVLYHTTNSWWFYTHAKLHASYTPGKGLEDYFSSLGEDDPVPGNVYLMITMHQFQKGEGLMNMIFSGDITLDISEQQQSKLAGWV